MNKPARPTPLSAILAVSLLFLGCPDVLGQFGHFVSPPPRPAITQPEAVARVVASPGPAQAKAILGLRTATQAAEKAVADARAAFAQAPFKSDADTLRRNADTLAAAELALARLRAEELARVQAGPSPLNQQQIDQIRARAQSVGRGGGGGRVGGGALPADPNTVIGTLPGFRIEIVAAADVPMQGSWISMVEDGKGRILLGANEQQPFTRLTLDAQGKVTRNETLYTPVSEAMGMEWHGNSLYVQGGRDANDAMVYGKENPSFCCESGPTGLQRLTEADDDGNFGKLETLRSWTGNEQGHSDHGVHAPKVSPDGRFLYIINGNGVALPDDISPNSPVRHLADDRIIPVLGAGGRGAGGNYAAAAAGPGGWGFGGHIIRTDFDGKDPHLMAMGLRNALHFAYNGDGEMFTYDSDHEPELGVPWYRPTRVLWAPVGANFGHRRDSSSGKYPGWWEDVVPPLFDVGLGSPVGVTFGHNTRFPAAYQKALYIADNNYGRIMAVHLKPSGSGYAVTALENIAWPKSLYTNALQTTHNVTDMMVARDGTFYYVIGNRSTQAYLMRLTYVGTEPTGKVAYANAEGSRERDLRHSLEAFHWQSENPGAVTAAWPHLGSDDRPIRYAARVALETVSPAKWKAKALAETDPKTALIALLALARVGGEASNGEIFAKLETFPLAGLPDAVKLQKLRVIQVAVSRNGKPSEAAIQRVIADIDTVFPARSFPLNTDLSQILAAFNSPTVAAKTLALAQATRNYQENFEYRYNLRTVTAGWTPGLRVAYFQWFQNYYQGGDGIFDDAYKTWFARVGRRPGTVGNDAPRNLVRTAAIATLTDAEKADPQLAPLLSARPGAGRGGQ